MKNDNKNKNVEMNESHKATAGHETGKSAAHGAGKNHAHEEKSGLHRGQHKSDKSK